MDIKISPVKICASQISWRVLKSYIQTDIFETLKYVAGFELIIAIFCHEIDPPSCAFPYFWMKCTLFSSTLCSLLICPTIILAFTRLAMFLEEHALWIPSLCVSPSPSVHAFVIGINILSRILFFNRVTLCSLHSMRGQVSHETPFIHMSIVKCWQTVSIVTLWENGYYKITS